MQVNIKNLIDEVQCYQTVREGTHLRRVVSLGGAGNSDEPVQNWLYWVNQPTLAFPIMAHTAW